MPTPDDYDQLQRLLDERVKELTLLHATTRLLQSSRPTLQVMLTELAALLPPAWQYPEICHARITYAGVEACTPGWSDTPWKLSIGFATSDARNGTIEIVYLDRKPAAAEGPFLAEERSLIDSIAELLTAYLERRRAEEKVVQLAYFEPVTGLPNRASLEEQLTDAVEAARAEGQSLALLLMDLSDFRLINNSLGHRNGDVLLRQVAGSLRTSLHEKDLLASLGNGEFLILLARLGDSDSVTTVIDKIEASLSRPALVAGVPVKVEGSIGIALYPEHGTTADVLLQRSDIALRAARAGNHNHLVYSAGIDQYEPQRIALLGELPEAIEQDQLTLHYQPKIELRSGRTVGVEALVRWQHPEHGLIYPDRFIPLAERTQIINSLTRWVLTRAVQQWQDWTTQGLQLGLSVNLSARNLLDPALGPKLLELTSAGGLRPEQLTLEITETAIMAEPVRAKRVMDELHSHGIQFSMDDFGVGQSSLTYLKDLPISKMKIDKSFVMDFGNARNAAIVRAAIELGHSLDMQITAEGVEDDATRIALQMLGCDLGQGYLFSKPMPESMLLTWLKESRWGSGL